MNIPNPLIIHLGIVFFITFTCCIWAVRLLNKKDNVLEEKH